MSISAFVGFGEDALDFYEGLAADNSRTYWRSHQPTYQDAVAGPLRALAETLATDFGEPKVFRPHRDLRFTPDKRPYQEFASMAVEPPKGENRSGALYLSLSLDGLMIAGGYYQPARDQLDRFRHLQGDPRVAADLDRTVHRLAIAGYPLSDGAPVKTAPRGWPRDHPRIAMIRCTSLTAGHTHPPGPWLHTGECLDRIRGGWRTLQVWNTWLHDHVGPSRESS